MQLDLKLELPDKQRESKKKIENKKKITNTGFLCDSD